MLKHSLALLAITSLFIGCGNTSENSSKIDKTSTKIVTTSIKAVNQTPVAIFDSFTIQKETRYDGELKAVDEDGDELKYEIVDKPKHGTVALHDNGCFTYTPDDGYQGEDSFSYRVSDTLNSSDIKIVTIDVCKPTIQAPKAPTNLTVEVKGTTKLRLSWDGDSNNDGYAIYQDGKLIATTKGDTFKDICYLKPNTTYSFEVRAKNQAGTSKATTVTGKTKDVTAPPLPPTDLKAIAVDKTTLRLTWKDNANNESSYEIYQNDKLLKTISINCSCTIIKDLTPNTKYSFKVVAVNKIGKSDSNTIEITTKSDKPKPINSAPIAKSQTITIDQDTNTTIKLTATDKDDDNLTYTITKQPKHGIYKNSIYTPNKNFTGEDTITFKANDGRLDSNEATITIKVKQRNKPEVINGYTLPPKPDPKINNSTLLGIDANNNGVRDDVERYIIAQYKDKHKAVTAIGFQIARAFQEAIRRNSNALPTDTYLDDAQDCNFYFELDAERFGDKKLIDHTLSNDFENLILNTKSRVKAYLEYDRQFSGGSYRMTPISEEKSKCSQEVLELVGGVK